MVKALKIIVIVIASIVVMYVIGQIVRQYEAKNPKGNFIGYV